MKALQGMTGKIIGDWEVGEKTTRGTHIAYTCTCRICQNTKVITATDLNRQRNLHCAKHSEKWTSYKLDSLTGTRQGSFKIGNAFRKNGRTYYHVICDCGREYDILRDNLLRKKYMNCKCRGSAVDPSKKYGMLQPIRRIGNGKWECRCDCGKTCYKVPGYLLRENMNLSCGCKKKADKIALRSDNQTGVKGVCYSAKLGKYLAYITKDGYTYRLGRFNTVTEAAAARKAKEKELFQ